jgi:uncharacterized protein (TIGR00290 family)
MQTAWLWWSSGKDSAWALHELRAAGVPVAALAVTVNRVFERVAMHAVRIELVRRQAEAAGLPLRVVEIPHPCSNDDYEAAFRAAMADARREGVGSMAFGDLFLEDVRAYRERLLAGSGIAPLFPLWGRDTGPLAREMLRGGLRAVVTCVDPKQVPAELAGRAFDEALLAALPAGADPCGERGEFHTFAWDGPMFARPIRVRAGARELRDGFVFADLLPEEESWRIRDYDGERDVPALHACFSELQEFERGLEADIPPGPEVAGAYLPLLFERCERWRGRIFVAEQGGSVVGFAAVQAAVPQEEPDDPPGPYALLSDLVLLPQARRSGIGRALLARAEEYARAEGAPALCLTVLARNGGARALYAEAGYRERFLHLEKRLGPAGDDGA